MTVGRGTDTTAPSAPVVNPVKAGTTAVTGTAEAGSTVEVTLPDGSKVSAKADQDGNFSVPVSGLKEGDTVSVTATDDAGNTSNPTSVTVGKGIDTIAPDAPVVNTDLTGKAGTRTPTVVKPSLSGKVESSTTLANHMNLKARANISSTEKDASTLPETGDEVSIGGVVLGGILAAAGLGLVGKRKKED